MDWLTIYFLNVLKLNKNSNFFYFYLKKNKFKSIFEPDIITKVGSGKPLPSLARKIYSTFPYAGRSLYKWKWMVPVFEVVHQLLARLLAYWKKYVLFYQLSIA
jgi:hypothetical protein